MHGVFTSLLTITVWAYLHAVAMTSGVYKKDLTRLVKKLEKQACINCINDADGPRQTCVSNLSN